MAKRRQRTLEQRQQQYKRITNYRRRLKLEMIAYKGGQCKLCGYSKHPAALEFHHRDRTEKHYQVSGKSLCFAKVKEELDKCDLLCANCHRELEAELKNWDVAQLVAQEIVNLTVTGSNPVVPAS